MLDLETNPLFWPALLAVGSFILFLEAVAILRFLLFTHQARWRWFLGVIPLAFSLWFFSTARKGLDLRVPRSIHMSTEQFLALRSFIRMTIEACQLQFVLALGIFLLLLFLERVFQMRYTSFLRHGSLKPNL